MENELALQQVLPHFQVVLFLQVSWAVVFLVVSENVSRVEVIVVDQIGLKEDTLNDQGEIVRSVESESHLTLGYTSKTAASTK